MRFAKFFHMCQRYLVVAKGTIHFVAVPVEVLSLLIPTVRAGALEQI